MQNQNQIICRTAGFLLASGLTAGLLPGFATAQDGSTPPTGMFTIPVFQEDPATTARRVWVAERFRGEKIVPNGKHSAKKALARLALNPDDAGAIEGITHFYDNVPAGSNPEQFSFSGVAWVLGKYWDKFTPAQRDHLKAKVKDIRTLMGHGTPNHAIMKCVAAYIFAERWPNEDGWVRGQYSSEQILQASRARILNVVNGYYNKNDVEWISQNYFGVNLWAFHALYDCARDPEIKYAAYAALCYHYASFAANNFRGRHISPFPRGRLEPVAGDVGSTWLTWLFCGPGYTGNVPTADGDFAFTRFIGARAMSTYAAVSDFLMPPAILSLWRGETAPYELKSSSAGFVYGGVTPGFWGTGEPGATNRYIYRHPDYAIGSGFEEYDPGGHYDAHHSNVSILYRSTKEWAFIETHHPYWRSNTRDWNEGINSPFMQTAQHKSAAIAIFNIPETDPWRGRGAPVWQAMRDQHFDNLIQEAFVRYPKSIDEMIEENGWVFLREGSVYIAIHPLKPYTIETNPEGVAALGRDKTRHGPVGENFNAIRSAYAQTGFVYDVATGAEFASFAAFRAAAIQNPPGVNWNTLSVTYTSLAGNKITATWNPPDYSGPPQTGWSLHNNPVGDVNLTLEWRPGLSGSNDGGWSWDDENKIWSGPPGDKWYPGSRVLVRPHITINGAVLPPPREYTPDRRPGQDPADFDYYIPMQSPSANIADGVLNVQTPGGELTVYAPRKK